MDLINLFETRRGSAAAPAPAPAKPVESEDSELDFCRFFTLALVGKLSDRYIYKIPVLKQYQSLLGGNYVMLCPDEDTAQRWQKKTGLLAFASGELQDLLSMMMDDMKKAFDIIAAKREFCGIVRRVR